MRAKCQVCKKSKPSVVDYEHGVDGKPLHACKKCHEIMSCFQWDPVIMNRAIEYLDYWDRKLLD